KTYNLESQLGDKILYSLRRILNRDKADEISSRKNKITCREGCPVMRDVKTLGLLASGDIWQLSTHHEMSRRVTTRDDIAAVIALYKANHVLREISAQTGVALRVVQNLVKRFRDLGEDELPALSLVGLNYCLHGHLRLFLDKFGPIPHSQHRETPVLLRCVQQALHDDLGFKSFHARRKPLLTKRQKENRVKFCKKYEVWDLETWRSVLWSDEATF
ncbi:putative Transposase-containing protein 10, partial [Homarus americanus]